MAQKTDFHKDKPSFAQQELFEDFFVFERPNKTKSKKKMKKQMKNSKNERMKENLRMKK